MWHVDAISSTALGGQHGIPRSFGRAHELVTGGGSHHGIQPGSANDLASKLKPGTIAGIGDVHNAGSLLMAEADDGASQVWGIGGTAALIVDHVNLGLGGSNLENGVRKTFAACSE